MESRRWIFLRGLVRGNAHWGDFPKVLQHLNPTWETEYLEIPGNGTVHSFKTPLSVEAVILFLRQRSRFSNQGQAFHICGVSLGGMIALKWAEMYPKEVESVAIINSSLQQCSPFYRRLRPNNYLRVLKSLMSSDVARQEEMILQITSNKFQDTSRYLKYFSDFSCRHPTTKESIMRQLLLANQIRIERFPDIPLKILSAHGDRLVSPSCSDEICKAFGGKQFAHPSAGHDLPLDDPEWVCEVLSK